MPDLSAKAAHAYWKKYPDPLIHRVLSFMESVETFPHQDNNLLKTILSELGKILEHLDIKKVDLAQSDYQEAFMLLGNYLKMTQTLRLLQVLDTLQPGSAARLIMHAETIQGQHEKEAKFFLRRNAVFERLRLLARIFSKERLVLVRKALEESI